jgi:hypothetical protein
VNITNEASLREWLEKQDCDDPETVIGAIKA